jgi:hypothetical protein
MCEPWYQSQSITEEEVLQVMQHYWFYQELHSDRACNGADEKLRDYIYRNFDMSFKNISFDGIRKADKWREKSLVILREEVQKAKESGLGSHRGYYTFVHDRLIKTYISRIIEEIWARSVLENFCKRYIEVWTEKRFMPPIDGKMGGKGFMIARANFADIVDTLVDER